MLFAFKFLQGRYIAITRHHYANLKAEMRVGFCEERPLIRRILARVCHFSGQTGFGVRILGKAFLFFTYRKIFVGRFYPAD